MKAGELEVKLQVVALDALTRTATLKGPKGNLVRVDVPVEVVNFNQVQVGDVLVIRYRAAIAARLEVVDNHGIRERIESTSATEATPGALPGASVEHKVEVLAVVKAINHKEGTVTLRGAINTITLAIPAGMDVSKVKVGSEVRAMYIEAVAVHIEAPPASPAVSTKPAAPAEKK